MYDELVKNLRHDSASALQNCDFDFVHDWMLKAADAIEGLSHAVDQMTEWRKKRWIPVTERLPEENEVVLVADNANDIGIGSLQPLWHGVVWVVPFEDVDNEFCPITHWMPLPEPPKDGEE